jgi:hypothetical protein
MMPLLERCKAAFIEQRTTIGSALKDADKIQRMARTDPTPSVPFVDVQAQPK